MAPFAQRHRQRARAAAHVEHRLAVADAGQLEEPLDVRVRRVLRGERGRPLVPVARVVEAASCLLEPFPLLVPIAGGQRVDKGLGRVVFGHGAPLALMVAGF